jgi:hypothetical protein
VARDRTRRTARTNTGPSADRRRGDTPVPSPDEAEARVVRAALRRGQTAGEFASALVELDQPTRARVLGHLQQTQGNAAIVGVIRASHGGGGSASVVQRRTVDGSGNVTECIGPVREQTYLVAGSNLAEIARTIAARPEAGKVSWSPVVHWDTRDDRAASIDLNVGITLEMPEWPYPAEVGPRVRAEWARWYEALRRHEQGHIHLVHQHFDGLADRMLGRRPRAVTRLFARAKAALAQASRDYDAATNHGRNMGTVIDVDVRDSRHE